MKPRGRPYRHALGVLGPNGVALYVTDKRPHTRRNLPGRDGKVSLQIVHAEGQDLVGNGVVKA